MPEYQCGKGILLKEETAARIGMECRENGIRVSIHAPYYINLSSPEEKKRERSVGYILETLRIAIAMGAVRIIMHPGYVSGLSRDTALEIAMDTLMKAISQAQAERLDHITICPEVLGKRSQLGNILEIAELCSVNEGLVHASISPCPCPHKGWFESKEGIPGYITVCGAKTRAGTDGEVHIHFSRIEVGKEGEEALDPCGYSTAPNLFRWRPSWSLVLSL